MWETCVEVEIASAPELKVLGYLKPRACQLQIGDTFINVDTKASPSSMIPSVKIFALKVDLSGFTESWQTLRYKEFANTGSVQTCLSPEGKTSKPITGTEQTKFVYTLKYENK
ncbi:hypothetical protein EJB05_16218 [Eragrostis curvula]|uniref:F-box/LRR-repeat protein 15/At3g58940/PEG3-like LRR domain-containing protein n=1 Tax=Eragrostis curvula TaxID=38414 RepID=A0A5J9VEH2_9POAL|nr:hypothetical protein EJB05_16218 [Eragrostis curvula]